MPIPVELSKLLPFTKRESKRTLEEESAKKPNLAVASNEPSGIGTWTQRHPYLSFHWNWRRPRNLNAKDHHPTEHGPTPTNSYRRLLSKLENDMKRVKHKIEQLSKNRDTPQQTNNDDLVAAINGLQQELAALQTHLSNVACLREFGVVMPEIIAEDVRLCIEDYEKRLALERLRELWRHFVERKDELVLLRRRRASL